MHLLQSHYETLKIYIIRDYLRQFASNLETRFTNLKEKFTYNNPVMKFEYPYTLLDVK